MPEGEVTRPDQARPRWRPLVGRPWEEPKEVVFETDEDPGRKSGEEGAGKGRWSLGRTISVVLARDAAKALWDLARESWNR